MLEDAAIRADLLQAQHVNQIRGKKTDANDLVGERSRARKTLDHVAHAL